MLRTLCGTWLAFMICTPFLPAQEDIQRGKIKKVDADKGIVTITVDGKDREFLVTAATKFIDATPQESAQGIRDRKFKEGATVMFKAMSREDGSKVLIGLKISGDGAPQGDRGGGIRRGTIKKLDLGKKTVTLTIAGKDQDFTLAENVQVPSASGKDQSERLKSFKEGSAVFFKTEKRNGKEVIVALKRAEGDLGLRSGNQPRVDTSNLRPLTELKTGTYHGHQGGLYPDGQNQRPAAHEAAGQALARQAQPLDADGKPSASGKIVLLSIGMSNTAQASHGFQQQLRAENEKNPRLVFLTGANG